MGADRCPGLATYTEDVRFADLPRPVILDGDCGIADCCGVPARIEIVDELVTWADFSARGSPPLPAGLRFTFDRAEYEGAIAGVGDLAATPVEVPDG
jgi:hypothetical protein